MNTISELEPLWSFMAFSWTFPMAASAHRAREMRRTPHGQIKHSRISVKCLHLNYSLSAVVEENTCYIEVGGNFAVSQCKPDESQTHTEGSRHIGQIVTFTWNTNMCWLLNVINHSSHLCSILKWKPETNQTVLLGNEVICFQVLEKKIICWTSFLLRQGFGWLTSPQ